MEGFWYVCRFGAAHLNLLASDWRDSVEGLSHLDPDAQVIGLYEFPGVVGFCKDRLGEVLSYFSLVYVEACYEADVGDGVFSHSGVCEPDGSCAGIAVVLHSLNEAAGAVSYAG